jgi:hypothetical protein
MNNKHIIELLENSPLSALSQSDKELVQGHCETCEPCARSYQAARLSTMIISERVNTPIEPSPFFQTRVMAAWRERQALESVPAWSRLWKSSRALVSSMVLTTAALGVLSFFTPAIPSVGDETASSYSAEALLMGQQSEDQMSYEQVLNTIYNGDDDDDVR